MPAPSGERVQVIVMSGRPAVGKTQIKDLLAAQMPREPAIISGDDIGTKDPRWLDLIRDNDLTAGSIVYYDSRLMVARAIAECVERRFDFLLDTNSDNPDRTRALLTQLREPDERGVPRCFVRFVGVSAARAVADLAVLARLQHERESYGGGRYVEDPDRGYPGVLATAGMVERECLADETYVFERGSGRPVYANGLTAGGTYRHPVGFVDAMEQLRNQPWTEQETRSFRDHVIELAGLPDGRTKLGRTWWPQLADIVTSAGPHAHSAIDLGELAGYLRVRAAGSGIPAPGDLTLGQTKRGERGPDRKRPGPGREPPQRER